ncbi:MAG TPA: methyltransferase [Vicinamibacterales bacterium]|nr:methyltransferase [Vicinamibacterales bacterium]
MSVAPRRTRWYAGLGAALARRRVRLGFLSAAVVLWLAEPTSRSVTWGAIVAAIGELIRIWAAGHVEKSREVTRSGPYRFTRHPLYLGSSIIGIGIAVASASWLAAALVFGYLAAAITAAIRAEEAYLREKFGGDYDAYAARTAAPMIRSFSAARARANREHHTIAGLIVALLLLAFKVGYSIR